MVKIPVLLETHGFELAVVACVDAVILSAKQTDAVGPGGPPPPIFIVGKAFTTPVPVAIFLVDAPEDTQVIFPESPLVLVFILK
jgi:hypothetical protein